MRISKSSINDINDGSRKQHEKKFNYLIEDLENQGINTKTVVENLQNFHVGIPSWALGAGGTRFGRFNFQGEPSNLYEKLDDIGILNSLTRSAGAVSLHIPWDIPKDYNAIKELAQSHEIAFDAMNSNTFQDQKNSDHSYKYGSLSSVDKTVREQAVQHNIEVLEIGKKLGSKSLTVWLSDGSSFPGQSNFQIALSNTQESLQQIYSKMEQDCSLFIEYKPYEPSFYSTVIQDWGTSLLLANACGERAYTLVDLGHHLPNTNIEQIVSTLMWKGKLGGFHFNDSKYGDDDLTVGSIKPYSLFLIFNELVYGMENNPQNPELSWMIDASHNIKDPLEDLLQSLEAIQEAYAKALIIDRKKLKTAQENNDVTQCQEILQQAFRTDVRPLLERARLNLNGAINPIQVFRQLRVRENLIRQRGSKTVATGL